MMNNPTTTNRIRAVLADGLWNDFASETFLERVLDDVEEAPHLAKVVSEMFRVVAAVSYLIDRGEAEMSDDHPASTWIRLKPKVNPS